MCFPVGIKGIFGGILWSSHDFNVNWNFGGVLLVEPSQEYILRMYKYEQIYWLKQAVKIGLLSMTCIKSVALTDAQNGKIILWWRENSM